MNYRLPTLVCALYAILVIATCVQAAPALASERACTEGSSCWTWSTMGNHKRGIYVRGRRSLVVVGPCAYQAIAELHSLDRARTAALRGDYTAKITRCGL